MESHSQIEDEVADWLARRDSGNWSEDDETRLQEWIAASTARRVAYLRLKSTWDTAGRLRALRGGAAAGTSAREVPPPGEWRHSAFFERSATGDHRAVHRTLMLGAPEPDRLLSGTRSSSTPDTGAIIEASIPRRRHVRFRLALAASISFLVVAGFTAYQFWDRSGGRYTTAVGGFASIPITDGSNITLNTDSEIRVELTERERHIDLEHGEAFFDVAPDKTRPFVVRAGNKRVIAVGTKFSVQHLGEDVRVLVTEGKVRVENNDSHATADNPAAGTVMLAAGDIAHADASAVLVQKAQPPQIEEFLSWREGYLRFHETSLAAAIAEFNRYNTRKIFIDDPTLAAIRISGTFRPTQYEAFVRVLQDGFSVQAQSEGERITLTQGQ